MLLSNLAIDNTCVYTLESTAALVSAPTQGYLATLGSVATLGLEFTAIHLVTGYPSQSSINHHFEI